MEDGGFCGGAARCGCGVFLRLPPPATTETTLGNPPRPLFSSPPQPAARLFHAAATAACPTVPSWWGVGFSKRWGKISLPLSLELRLPFSLFVPSLLRAQSPAIAVTFLTILPPMTTRGLLKHRAVFRTPSSLHRTTRDPRDVQGEINFRK